MDEKKIDGPHPEGGAETAEKEPPLDDDDVGPGPATDDLLRERIIEAAFRVVTERLAEEGPVRARLLSLRWIDQARVAEKAGLDESIFSELWPTPSDERAGLSSFESFLIDAFSVFSYPTIDDQAADVLREEDLDLEDFVRRASTPMLTDHQRTGFAVSLAVSLLAGHARMEYVGLFEEAETVYGQLAYGFGRRMREPFGVRDMAIAILSGLEAPWLLDIYGVEDPNPVLRFAAPQQSEKKDWPLSAILAWTMVAAMTEPFGDSSIGEPFGDSSVSAP